ncbi:hypothetical protein ABW19_dt0207572 [Dactylella cylindrospora]|nr:hypothetical protein ABW19_dt0207572 [Dactylella cylindrospora]
MPAMTSAISAAILRARENALARGTGGEADEICPVCKSSRYLNPNMRFLVNPECYHKMCESCVDRLFSQGPSQCPVVGCDKILRKQKFRKQTFEDIQVEREVDIRKRIAKTFNKRQEDFPSLKDFNDYLEEVETVTFNLINNVDVQATEAKITAFEQANKASILQNAAKAATEAQQLQYRQEFEREQHRKAREMAEQAAEEEKRDKQEERAFILKQLQAGESVDVAVAKATKLARKKSSMRKENQERRARELEAARNAPAFQFISNLNRVGEEPEKPYDPLDGYDETTKYFVFREKYENPWLEGALNDKPTQAGGYFVNQYCERAIFEAFSGVGCFIEEDPSLDTPMTDAIAV